MAIPPVGSGEDVFEKMHGIFLSVKEKDIPNVSMDILSMGMSGDYELAIKAWLKFGEDRNKAFRS